jgi:cobalt/nickel transport system permease protein
MHIKDGILSPEVCLATGALAVGAVALSLHKLKDSLSDRTIPFTGMMGALVFAGQMVNFPLPLPGAPVSGHLLGGVLSAVVLGPWAGCLAMTLVLLVQLALFSDGGWTVLGANILNMGVIGALGGYAVYAATRRLLGNNFAGTVCGAVLAAWVSVLAGAGLFCLEFRLSFPEAGFNFRNIYALMTVFHCAIGVVEALITGLVVSFVLTRRPGVIYQPAMPRYALAGVGRTVWAGAIAALAVAAFLAPFASEAADGLEAVGEREQFNQLEAPAKPLVWSDYAVLPSENWQKVSVSLAGIIGTGSVLGVALLLGLVLKPRLAAPEVGHGA